MKNEISERKPLRNNFSLKSAFDANVLESFFIIILHHLSLSSSFSHTNATMDHGRCLGNGVGTKAQTNQRSSLFPANIAKRTTKKPITQP
jgi:hypothetical protein